MRLRRARPGIDLGEETDLDAAIAGSSLGGVVAIDGAMLGVACDADVRRVELGAGEEMAGDGGGARGSSGI